MSLGTNGYNAIIDFHGANHYARNGKRIILRKGKGIYVEDTDGVIYIDAAAGFSSVNLGHNHPGINAVGRALYSVDDEGWGIVNVAPNTFPNVAQALFIQHACNMLHYDRCLVMNSGTEAVETAIKLTRKWGYAKKHIPKNEAIIIVCEGNFHGRSTTIVGFSDEPTYRDPFGPFAGGFITVPFGDSNALRNVLEEKGKYIAGFLVEPIQGERGVRIPANGYIHSCYQLCKEYNVLFIADEIQTGLGRTGALLACTHEHVLPDVCILGKSLGAGRTPVSAVFTKSEYMVFEPGEHGSTYGGNATSMMIALEVLEIIKRERLCENSLQLGKFLLDRLAHGLLGGLSRDIVRSVRGYGLMIAIEPREFLDAEDMVQALLEEGVLTKSAHNVVRITPPLTITRSECEELLSRIQSAMRKLADK